MDRVNHALLTFLETPLYILLVAAGILLLVICAVNHHYVRLIFKSLERNLLRTFLTSLATMVMVFVVTVVWSILALVDSLTAEKAKDFKAIISDKYQMPSQMPRSYAPALCEGAPNGPDDYHVKPEDSMTWGFYIGTNDQKKISFDSVIFFFTMEPERLASFDKNGKFTSMMDDIDQLSEEQRRQLEKCCQEMVDDPTKVIVGEDRLNMMHLKAPCEIQVYGKGSFQDLDLRVKVIGTFPAKSKYGQNAIMNYKYIENALDDYKRQHKGTPHPQDGKTLALVWLRVPNKPTYSKVEQQIGSAPEFTNPKVKCETLSSGIGNFLEGYQDMLAAMRWVLAPFAMLTMAMVIAVAISIGVRERRGEMAVLKVLGFSPNQIMILVLGEAVFLGVDSGLVVNLFMYVVVNKVFGGIPFPIGFSAMVPVSADVIWWGPLIGGLTALAGSIFPAWAARSVKVSEVFSKIA